MEAERRVVDEGAEATAVEVELEGVIKKVVYEEEVVEEEERRWWREEIHVYWPEAEEELEAQAAVDLILALIKDLGAAAANSPRSPAAWRSMILFEVQADRGAEPVAELRGAGWAMPPTPVHNSLLSNL